MGAVEIGALRAGHMGISYWESKPDAAGGVGVSHSYYISSDRPMKYITFVYVAFNAVGDPIKCSVSGETEGRVKITGPFKPGDEYELKSGVFWYNPTVSKVKLQSATVQYMDDTTETFDGKDILSKSDKNSVYYDKIGRVREVTLIYVSRGSSTDEKYEGDAETVTIKKHIKYIGERALRGEQRRIYFEEGSCLEKIFANAFDGCFSSTLTAKYKIFALPATVQSIEKNAFLNCKYLKKVFIPENCQVADGAFDADCTVIRASDPAAAAAVAVEESTIDLDKAAETAKAVAGEALGKMKGLLGKFKK